MHTPSISRDGAADGGPYAARPAGRTAVERTA